MLNSKEILEQTGISRATLNNYIGWGIVPKPEVLPPEPSDGDAPRIGYFPDAIVGRIAEIQRLKKDGWSMARIAEHFGPKAAPQSAAGTPEAVRQVSTEEAPPSSPAAPPITTSRVAPQAAPPGAPFPEASRRPVLRPVAILAADLEHASSIWSELPAEEYFELISDVWSTADPIFRRHSGSHGKHPADGMVCHFFPLVAGDYRWNAVLAATELQHAMRRVSKEWQLRKGWTTELYMNIGVDEGQEWLGSVRAGHAPEFTALAETLRQAVRISDFARFGAVWATKNLLSRLQPEDLRRVKYGVRRKNAEGQHVFVPSVFSNVRRVTVHASGDGGRPKDVALLPITEIVEISPPQDR